MAKNKGSLVTATVRPSDERDKYPVVLANEIKGGNHTVATLIDRDNIPLERREEGMFCYVLQLGKRYELKGGLTNEYWFEETGIVYTGSVFITNVIPVNGHLTKTYIPNTNNGVIESITTDTYTLEVYIQARIENCTWLPNVTIDGQNVEGWHETNTGRWEAIVIVQLNEDTENLTAQYIGGCDHVVQINIQTEGPNVLTYSLGPNPALPWEPQTLQTHVKEGDLITISGVVEAGTNRVEVLDSGIFKAGGVDIQPGTTVFTFQAQVSNRSGNNLTTILKARNTLGTWGVQYTDPSQKKDLDQITPVISNIIVGYPANQQAIKNNEIVSCTATITNHTHALYRSPNTELSIVNAFTYDAVKNAMRIRGNYNYTVPNYEVVARRNTNGYQVTKSTVVKIANIPPVLSTHLLGDDRLRSTPEGYHHRIGIATSQELQYFSMEATPGAGTLTEIYEDLDSHGLQEDSWYTHLIVTDNDTQGVHPWLNVVAINEAGLVTNQIQYGPTYEIGGFFPRDITFDSFYNISDIGVNVVNPNKVVALDIPGGIEMTLSEADGRKHYWVESGSSTIIWNDTMAVSENSQATAGIRIEELP